MTNTTMTDSYAWLAALQPGDQVIVCPGHLNDDFIARVKRLTTTQVIIAGEPGVRTDLRFRLRDGHAVGDSGTWGPRAWIAEPTRERVAEVREAAKRKRIIYRIRNTSWKEQPTAVLEAVDAALSSST